MRQVVDELPWSGDLQASDKLGNHLGTYVHARQLRVAIELVWATGGQRLADAGHLYYRKLLGNSCTRARSERKGAQFAYQVAQSAPS